MLLRIIAITFATAFIALLSSETSAQTRVNFKKGSSKGQVLSTLAAYGEHSFVLRAKVGQTINAKITSKYNRTVINEEEGALNLTFEAKDGDNLVEIRNTSRFGSRYKIVFAIKNKVLPPPIRIKFAPGRSSKTIDLEMHRYKKSKRFVIRALKGQTIFVSIESNTAAKRIAMDLKNAGKGDDSLNGFGYLRVLTGRDADYIFEVSKSDEKYFKAKIKIRTGSKADF